MSNMSYCRFQNTLGDLNECVAALERGDISSNIEIRAAIKLIRVCLDIAKDWRGLDDNEIEGAICERAQDI